MEGGCWMFNRRHGDDGLREVSGEFEVQNKVFEDEEETL